MGVHSYEYPEYSVIWVGEKIPRIPSYMWQQSVATLGKVHSFDEQSPPVCAPQQERVCVCLRE